MQPNTSPKKSKLLVTLFIFLLPALVIIGFAYAFFHKANQQGPALAENSAFNTRLPAPNLPKDEKNKLELYMQAQADSLKRKQERDNDPNVTPSTNGESLHSFAKTPDSLAHSDAQGNHGITAPTNQDVNEAKVNDRMKKLYAVLGTTPTSANRDLANDNELSTQAAHTDKLQRLMSAIQTKDTSSDPKINQINTLLDKIMDIQHPERIAQKSSSNIINGLNKPITVSTTPRDPDEVGLQPEQFESVNGFFGLTDDIDSTAGASNSIEAVIHSSQTVTTGAIVKLRLLQDIYLNGTKIPANSFIYGPCSVNGERVNIQLTNAIYDEKIYAVQLRVFDGSDGLEGLYVPGSISRDVIKENSSQGITGMNVATLDPSIGAQAAAAGIETAKNLLSRKVRLVKVTLKAGHVVILKNPDINH